MCGAATVNGKAGDVPWGCHGVGDVFPPGWDPRQPREGSNAFSGVAKMGLCLGDPEDLGASPLPGSGSINAAVPPGEGCPLPRGYFWS